MKNVIDVTKKVAAKYFAVHHHDITDRVDYSLARVLALYGLLRVSEMDLGVNFVGEVDKRIAAMLVWGSADQPPYPHFQMGGTAGAYRFYQGGYKVGQRENCWLAQAAQELRSRDWAAADSETLLAVGPTLALAGVVLQQPEMFDAALDLCETTSAALFDPATGLYRAAEGSSSWANACAAAALAEILRYMPFLHARRAALQARLHSLLDRLIEYQTLNGLWRSTLSAAESKEETASSALIAYALFSAAAQTDRPGPTWQAAVTQAWSGLQTQILLNGNGNVLGVAASPAPDAPAALNDLRGFGPLLLACAAYAWLRRGQIWSALPLSQGSFAPPRVADVEKYFAGLHATCETNHNGDGSYYHGTMGDPEITFDEIIKESRTEHPIPRDTAHCVLGYLDMVNHDPQAIYVERARAGLDWLVKEQEPDGCYRLWTRKTEGQVPHHGCLFDTGIVAAALVKGYEHFQDARYLAASARAAQWELDWPVDRNVNFNAFAIWHLAEHYRLTHDEALLERTIYKTRQAMLAPQQVTGGWSGHNSWIWYHGINVRAYAALWGVLPAEHPFRIELGRALHASLSYACGLMMENGAIHPNPENLDKPSHLMFEIIVGVVMAQRGLNDPALRSCLDGLMAYRISAESGDPEKLYNNEKGYWLHGCSPWYIYALGAYLALTAPSGLPGARE